MVAGSEIHACSKQSTRKWSSTWARVLQVSIGERPAGSAPKIDLETEWEIKEQVNVQGYFTMHMLSLFENGDHNYFKLCRWMDSCVPSGMPKTFEKESKLIPFALLANYALSQYENLKRCLLFALDSGKTSLEMTSRTTYGKIIDKLRQYGMDLPSRGRHGQRTAQHHSPRKLVRERRQICIPCQGKNTLHAV